MGMPLANNEVSINSTSTGTGRAIDLNGMSKRVTMQVVGEGAVSAGNVQLETAPVVDYSGAWAALGSPVAVPSDAVAVLTVEGAFQAVRTRLVTNVTGGTTKTYISAE